jgi:glutamate-1-semialdehyde 2,1-aminomutase
VSPRDPAPLADELPRTFRSEALYTRALGLIPAATQTLAKGPGQFVRGVAPKYLARGRGARVWDVDGNEYLDFSMAVGPLSLGHCYPAVDEAIAAQLRDGITFSLMHPLEVEVAELLREVVPGAESVRYGKTGAEVTSAAVRLARAFTGRDRVLCCGYHGWHDWFIATTDRARGVPAAARELSFTIPYNDLGAAREAIDEQTACVVLEPVAFEAPAPGYLEGLREECDRAGALLVFDEMWTGFRLALGGAQERFAVRADLACFSKAVANGMPLSVLTGRRDVMGLLDRDVFFFTTFGGRRSLSPPRRPRSRRSGTGTCRPTSPASAGASRTATTPSPPSWASPGGRRASASTAARWSPSTPRREIPSSRSPSSSRSCCAAACSGRASTTSPSPTPGRTSTWPWKRTARS